MNSGTTWVGMKTMLSRGDCRHDPFRKLLVHPAVISRLNELCGKRFRFDHGPWLITGRQGMDGQRLHGGGEPFSPGDWYHEQNNTISCRAVTVSWQLTDVPDGAGGFCCIPGSHKSKYPVPEGVKSCDADMGGKSTKSATAWAMLPLKNCWPCNLKRPAS